MLTGVFLWGHDKMRSGADRHWSVLIIRSFDWSAFCHFFQQFVYNNQQLQPQPTANPNTNPNHIPNPISNPNPTMITDLQIGLIDPQIVTIQIRPADLLRSAFCPVPFLCRGYVGENFVGQHIRLFSFVGEIQHQQISSCEQCIRLETYHGNSNKLHTLSPC